MQPTRPGDTPPQAKGQGIMSGLLGDLSRTLRELVREELQLARNQVSDKALDVATDAGIVAAGGAVAYAGYLTILGGVVDGMNDLGMPRWAAGLFVGSMAMAGGTALILRGLDNMHLKEPVVKGAKEQMGDTADEIQDEMR